MSQIVRDAIAALDSFGAVTASEAARLLPMWARYGDMSADDITAVLDHYRKGGEKR